MSIIRAVGALSGPEDMCLSDFIWLLAELSFIIWFYLQADMLDIMTRFRSQVDRHADDSDSFCHAITIQLRTG